MAHYKKLLTLTGEINKTNYIMGQICEIFQMRIFFQTRIDNLLVLNWVHTFYLYKCTQISSLPVFQWRSQSYRLVQQQAPQLKKRKLSTQAPSLVRSDP